MTSIFSKIIAGEEPASLVYRDELVVAFLDVAPITPGHTLVVPVEEISSFTELDERTCEMMSCITAEITRSIKNHLEATYSVSQK